jgi:hypothetical protein
MYRSLIEPKSDAYLQWLSFTWDIVYSARQQSLAQRGPPEQWSLGDLV